MSFALDKVIRLSECGNYAVIFTKDCFAELPRTVYSDTIDGALGRTRTETVAIRMPPDRVDRLVGVRVSDLKELRPDWLITEAEILKRFEAMQQDTGPILEGELLDAAKRVWGQKVYRR